MVIKKYPWLVGIGLKLQFLKRSHLNSNHIGWTHSKILKIPLLTNLLTVTKFPCLCITPWLRRVSSPLQFLQMYVDHRIEIGIYKFVKPPPSLWTALHCCVVKPITCFLRQSHLGFLERKCPYKTPFQPTNLLSFRHLCGLHCIAVWSSQ